MIRPKQVPAAALKVTLFWWAISLALYFNKFDKFKTFYNVAIIIAALITGVIATAFIIWQDRKSKEDALAPVTIRGMGAFFASIPIHCPPLKKSEDFPDADFYPIEVQNFVAEWRKTIDKPYQALLDEVMQTLWFYKETPAAPLMKKEKGEWVSNNGHNHGGRSLVTHSLLVANLMCEQAKYYKYDVPKHNGAPLFQKLDPSYVFDPEDPLIPIIGLAHDIGKIECMVWENGLPNKLDAGHDFKGARIVSRMESFWDEQIDAESRRILQTILAHYHHVQDVPMSSNGQPTSDRLHALLELLVKCDKVASAIENCSSPEKVSQIKAAALANESDPGLMYEVVKPDAEELINVIQAVILGPGRINNRIKGDTASIGWKYRLPHYKNKTVLVLKEDSFIQAVADFMGEEISPVAKTGGTNPVLHLTQEVLKTLNVANLLFNDFDEYDRSAMSQLYRVDFYDPTKYFQNKELTIPVDDLSDVPKLFSLDSVICLEIDNYEPFKRLVEMPDYKAIFHFGRARLGRQGVKATDKRLAKSEEPIEANIVDRIAAIQKAVQAKKESNAIPSPVPSGTKFRTQIEREFARGEGNMAFEFKMDEKEAVIYNFENWLSSEFKMTFEEIGTQSDEWKKLAGVRRTETTRKGTKIIYIERVRNI